MINAVTTFKVNGRDVSVCFDVNASRAERRITVSVRTYGLGEDNVDLVFPPDQYGEAMDRYYEICDALEKQRDQ